MSSLSPDCAQLFATSKGLVDKAGGHLTSTSTACVGKIMMDAHEAVEKPMEAIAQSAKMSVHN